jgi:hypothetical protein
MGTLAIIGEVILCSVMLMVMVGITVALVFYTAETRQEVKRVEARIDDSMAKYMGEIIELVAQLRREINTPPPPDDIRHSSE